MSEHKDLKVGSRQTPSGLPHRDVDEQKLKDGLDQILSDIEEVLHERR